MNVGTTSRENIMTNQTEERSQPMALAIMARYDQDGESAMIEALGELAHPAQTHETWRDAGICALEDGTAAVQS